MRFIYILLFVLFFFNQSYSETQFYKCPEKITKVTSGNNSIYQKGKKLGNNFIELDKSNSKPVISIYYQYTNSKEKPFKIMKNKDTNITTLGFDVTYKLETEKSSSENYYNFIKISDTYAFTKKEFWWSAKDANNDEQTRNYEAGGRCIKLKTHEYNAVWKKTGNNDIDKLTAKKIKKTSKIQKKKVEKNINKKNLKGKRAFAMSWENYDDLIVGSLTFNEINLIGQLKFELPNNDGGCVGTYVLSTNKGTWSVLCESKNINASGTLKWNDRDGSVVGIGKDEKGNKVKFKVAGAE